MAIENLNERLAQIVDKSPSSWADDFKWRETNKSWLKRSQLIAIKVLKVLRERKLTQVDLAHKMGVSAQQINKVVKGKENLTLETITKIESALSIQLIDVNSVETISLKVHPYRRVSSQTERLRKCKTVFKNKATIDNSFKQYYSSDESSSKLRTAS